MKWRVVLALKHLDLLIGVIVAYCILYGYLYGWGTGLINSILLALGLIFYHLMKRRRTETQYGLFNFLLALIWSVIVLWMTYFADSLLPITPLPPGLLVDPPPSYVYFIQVNFGVYPSFLLLINMIIDVLHFEMKDVRE